MTPGGARFVAAGIVLSRIFGLVRQRVSAHFLGSGLAADALAAAFRIPNLLQNLFGEGSLSASFIPVYARLLAEGRREEAGRVAGAVLALLATLVSVVVLLGVLLAPWLVAVIAMGFADDTRELTVLLVRIIFPGLGLLVLSAWCLGVLNTHRRFFLSYASPVLWNVAIIAALVVAGPKQEMAALVVIVAGASVVGSFLQFAIQVPTVLRIERGLRLSAGDAAPHVREVVRNFGPAVATRGVVQVSAYVDALIASLIGAGAMATLGYAQAISMLPVSVFGMSISAAELPTMSAAQGSEGEIGEALRARLASGLQRIAYFVIPSAVALALLGGVLAGGLYEGGAFTRSDTQWVWGALAGSAVGLLAGTMGRLYSSALFALRDTRTPFRFAVVRVTLGGVLGAVAALWLPRWLAVDARWGVAALTAASGVAAWVEFGLLRRALHRRIGAVAVGGALRVRLWMAAVGAGVVGVAATRLVSGQAPLVVALIVVPAFGATYLGLTRALGADRARRA
ncbi:MAG: murein biosynthesis integral membrane protein MurJ [Gemmatimonadaceae bacterium]